MSAQTDRELLELAAKAAGIDVDWEDGMFKLVVPFRGHLVNYTEWNPLTDDGDALRLAVKAGLTIYPHHKRNDDVTVQGPAGRPWVRQDAKGDPAAATRRAIVRAAAATGQKGK